MFLCIMADFVKAFWSGASFELLRDVSLAVAGMYRLYVVLYYDGEVVRETWPEHYSGE